MTPRMACMQRCFLGPPVHDLPRGPSHCSVSPADENIAEIEKLLQVSQHSARGGSNGSIGGSKYCCDFRAHCAGCGGMRFYSAEYPRRVRDLCDDYGTLLF